MRTQRHSPVPSGAVPVQCTQGMMSEDAEELAREWGQRGKVAALLG